MAKPRNINTAGSYIGGDNRAQCSRPKITKYLLPDRLPHITMQGIDSKSADLHEFSQRIGAPTGPHENQHLANIVAI